MNLDASLKPVHAPPSAGERLLEIDALRGLAILIVLANHFTTRFGEIYGFPTDPLYIIPQDNVGPHAMFVISGFVTAATIGRARSARDYMLTRLIRLAPVFWAGAILTFTIVRIFRLPGREVGVGEAYLNLTMLPGLFGARAIDGAYWTLQIQLGFFILVALTIAVGASRFLWLVVGTITTFHLIAKLGIDSGNVSAAANSWYATSVSVSGHAAFFLIGIMIAIMKAGFRWWHLALVVLASADMFIPRDNQARLVIAITAAVMFIGANFRFRGLAGKLLVGPLALVGTFSYALYVVNQNIGYVIMRAAYAHGLHTYTGIVLATIASFALAIALTYGVERPISAFFRRKRKKRQALAASSASGPAL